ncbi:hypothetical protein OG782_36770 [Streptomyces sp. NBC_00876]|uniref:hypothetical protein n=1 Tax=Streptomyces sp. NBC_00876 TaxID=2975853 RepID=UPI003867E4AE|nr:hypothetical protein OG782_36770 [Streptomyces sp. NBC_00876]
MPIGLFGASDLAIRTPWPSNDTGPPPFSAPFTVAPFSVLLPSTRNCPVTVAWLRVVGSMTFSVPFTVESAAVSVPVSVLLRVVWPSTSRGPVTFT